MLVDPRNKSDGIQSRGLFKGARVMRGENWKQDWRDQDGGAGNKGTIISIRCDFLKFHQSHDISENYRLTCSFKIQLS